MTHILNSVKELAESKGWVVEEVLPLPHQYDSHLLYALVSTDNHLKNILGGGDKLYSTHLYNQEVNGFSSGHYDYLTFEKAREDLFNRLK